MSKYPKPHIFGIRHHGPGSARSLVRALNDLMPDIILIEGPPDANEVIHLLAQLPLSGEDAFNLWRPVPLGVHQRRR